MQLNFNHIEHLPLLRPLHSVGQLWCWFVVVALLTVNPAAHGQWFQQGFPPQPRHFGDTPSPTEMMARLKLHKQQETPLFDLLREAGDDIFSKLSDDEKKLAGRFVEDMILKEGMDSDKVSSLLEHMNINDAAKQALQDGIERAAGESAISPEDRKKLANQIRKQFLQQSDSSGVSPSNTDRNPPNSDAEQVAGDLAKPFDEKVKSLQRLVDKIRKQQSGRQGQQEIASEDKIKLLKRQFDELKKRVQANQQFPPAEARTGNTNIPNRASDQITGAPPPPNSQQPNTAPNSLPQPPRDLATSPTESATSPEEQPLNKLLTQESLRQLEKQLSEPQQKVISELKDKIQNGNATPQEIEDLFNALQSSQSPNELAEQLDEVGKSIGLPADSREEIQKAFSQLSDDQRRSLQQTLNGVNEPILSDLVGRPDQEQPSTEPSAASSQQPPFLPNANTDLANDSQIDLGREFLQDALETYNDPDSGYKLSDAFQRLKDQAEGVTSDRELANLGNITKKLFEDSSKIFDSNSASQARKNSGVKPGQRFDQLLASAANKALEDNGNRNKQEDDSALSGVLNQALGVAIDQAVTAAADKDLSVRTHDATTNWNEPSELSYFDNSNWQDQLDFPEDDDSNFQPYDSAASPTTNNSPYSTNSSESSLQDSAARLGDAFSDFKFDGQTIFYAVGLITLLAGCIYLLSRLMQPVSEEELKQRALQRKLKANSANPKDLVEAVDLFLLSRFGAASSWWNAKHAATQISEVQPDWRDKVASLFQVYRWSRYQANGQASVSPEQNDLVKSTLRELSQVPIESFDKSNSSPDEAQDAEGQS